MSLFWAFAPYTGPSKYPVAEIPVAMFVPHKGERKGRDISFSLMQIDANR